MDPQVWINFCGSISYHEIHERRFLSGNYNSTRFNFQLYCTKKLVLYTSRNQRAIVREGLDNPLKFLCIRI